MTEPIAAFTHLCQDVVDNHVLPAVAFGHLPKYFLAHYPNHENCEDAIQHFALGPAGANRWGYTPGDPRTLTHSPTRKREDESWYAWLVRQEACFTSRETTPEGRQPGGWLASPPPLYRSLSSISEEQYEMPSSTYLASSTYRSLACC